MKAENGFNIVDSFKKWASISPTLDHFNFVFTEE